MIADRLIEQGTLRTDGTRVRVEVRMPWYRALPASSIAGADLVVDGVAADPSTLRWTMNGRTWRFEELPPRIDDWWFIQDPAVLEGELAVAPGEHEVEVGLRLYIPYIVTDHGVLMIDEHGTRTMEAVSA